MGVFGWYSRFHWRLFNILIRVFGIVAVLFGVSSVVAGTYYAVYPSAAEGMETLGLPASALSVLVGILCGAIGVSVLRVSPYRPDLGDAAWTFSVHTGQKSGNQPRSWWTGEPKVRARHT